PGRNTGQALSGMRMSHWTLACVMVTVVSGECAPAGLIATWALGGCDERPSTLAPAAGRAPSDGAVTAIENKLGRISISMERTLTDEREPGWTNCTDRSRIRLTPEG